MPRFTSDEMIEIELPVLSDAGHDAFKVTERPWRRGFRASTTWMCRELDCDLAIAFGAVHAANVTRCAFAPSWR